MKFKNPSQKQHSLQIVSLVPERPLEMEMFKHHIGLMLKKSNVVIIDKDDKQTVFHKENLKYTVDHSEGNVFTVSFELDSATVDNINGLTDMFKFDKHPSYMVSVDVELLTYMDESHHNPEDFFGATFFLGYKINKVQKNSTDTDFFYAGVNLVDDNYGSNTITIILQ